MYLYFSYLQINLSQKLNVPFLYGRVDRKDGDTGVKGTGIGSYRERGVKNMEGKDYRWEK